MEIITRSKMIDADIYKTNNQKKKVKISTISP
jgi:hypothetical protein